MAGKLPKPADLRALDDAHLTETLKDVIQTQFDLRFRTTSGDQSNSASESKKLRRQIARIKTIQRQRELSKQK